MNLLLKCELFELLFRDQKVLSGLIGVSTLKINLDVFEFNLVGLPFFVRVNALHAGHHFYILLPVETSVQETNSVELVKPWKHWHLGSIKESF